ncbi:hypothetical protein Slin14017_G043070 [Septoria linicola]|nr:hypothetical protein Slin14017_G043070 [Septoria linicola]
MVIVLAINSMMCGLCEKVAMAKYDRQERKKNKKAAAAARASIITISMVFLLIISALIPTATATPVANIRRDPHIAPHTQSCKCHQQGLVFSYNVHIGEPYNDGDYCDGLYNKILAASANSLSMYRCNNDGNGDTTLHFNVLSFYLDVDAANRELAKIYPKVNGFNCPLY